MQKKDWYLAQLLYIRPAGAPDYIPFVVHATPVAATDEETLHFLKDFYSLIVVRQGKGLLIVDGVPYAVTRGDVYLVRPGSNHVWSQCERLFVDTCNFSLDLFDADTLNALRETPGFRPLFLDNLQSAGSGARWLRLSPEAYNMAQNYLAEIRSEWLVRTSINTLLTKFAFIKLLAHLSLLYSAARPGAQAAATPVVNFKRASAREITVAAAVRFIDERYADAISIEQVAEAVFLSPVRLREIFGSVMGCSPRDYLRHVRIEQAKLRLRSTNEPIARIAWAVGLGEASYFGRAFREATGMSPSEYRKKRFETSENEAVKNNFFER